MSVFVNDRMYAYDKHQNSIELETSRVYNRASDQHEVVQSEKRGCDAAVSHMRAWHEADMMLGSKPMMVFEDDETPCVNFKAQLLALLKHLVIQGHHHRIPRCVPVRPFREGGNGEYVSLHRGYRRNRPATHSHLH